MPHSIIKFPPATGVKSRIIQSASTLILSKGFSKFTMAELAGEVGISKKTLYVHFPTKQALASEVIDTVASGIRSASEAILDQTDITFTEKLAKLIAGIVERLSKITPSVLKDIQRHEPDIFRRIEAVRAKAIPFVFSRILEEGRLAGAIRDDVNFALAIDYHLQALQGLLASDTLTRLDMTQGEVAEQALKIFFNGMLINTGGPAHEKTASS
jgi:AcrR family transcriptional regulator